MLKYKFPLSINGLSERYSDVLQFVYPVVQRDVYNFMKSLDKLNSDLFSVLIFGSSVSPHFNSYSSDLDFAIVVRDDDYNAETKTKIFRSLDIDTPREVDLLFCKLSDFNEPFTNPIYKEIKSTAIIIYEGGVFYERYL